MTEIASGGVTLVGIPQQDFRFTFRLTANMTAAAIGKPVALSPAANNTVRLAGDGDVVIGRLLTYRNLTTEGIMVGTVELKGGFRFNTTGVVAIGDQVVGSVPANGSVKQGVNPRSLVVAVNGATADVIFI
jgi:hypothetical protein